MQFIVEIVDESGASYKIMKIEHVSGWKLYGTGLPDEALMLAITVDVPPQFPDRNEAIEA